MMRNVLLFVALLLMLNTEASAASRRLAGEDQSTAAALKPLQVFEAKTEMDGAPEAGNHSLSTSTRAMTKPIQVAAVDEKDDDDDGRHGHHNAKDGLGLWGEKALNTQLPVPPTTTWTQYQAFLLAKDSDITSTAPLPSGWSWGEYHTSATVGTLLNFLQQTYPSIASSFSIGNSRNGRPLRALKIGSNPDQAPGVPKVKLVGNMHGDEVAGCEVLLRLAWDLCRRYRNPQDTLGITQLLDTVNIYILPTMNPDGYDATPRTRYNAANVDLNRAFPRLGNTAKEARVLEPEVQAMIDWTAQHNFALSTNLHGGALVANYPFDACDRQGYATVCPTPEDPTPYSLARAVADPHVRMRQSPEFANGVTRGSDWYPVVGGMQDWVWFATQGMELTLEVHEDKEPDNSLKARLPYLYLEMRDPLLEYTKSVHHSLKGSVIDGSNDDQAAAAQVLMLPVAQSGQQQSKGRMTSTISSGALKGAFTRLITPGVRYCVQVKAEKRGAQWAVVELPAGSPKVASSSIAWTFRVDKSRRGSMSFLGAAANLSDAAKESASQQCRQLLSSYVA